VAVDAADRMTIDDNVLWWLMVGTALIAAATSIGATILDRRASDDSNQKLRFSLHMIGYVMMSISVLVFVLRGLLSST
jgi:hypothetical protein